MVKADEIDDLVTKSLKIKKSILRMAGFIGGWLPSNDVDVEDAPNFKEMNRGYMKLFDEVGFNKFVDEVVDKINSFLSQ